MRPRHSVGAKRQYEQDQSLHALGDPDRHGCRPCAGRRGVWRLARADQERAGVTPTPVQVQGVAPPSFADTVDQVRPAVVSVRVQSIANASSQDNFFDLPPGSPLDRFFRQFRQDNPQAQPGPQRPQTALGSGFFISEDGYVVTNNHVVDGEQSVTVITDAGKEYKAKVIGTDDKTDLALIKIDAPGTKFTYVKFSEAEPRIGDWVVAVGNPFGLGGTVTAGIISARGRNIGAGPYDDFLQIDAAVNRGNSGGPTFNYKGEVIGVNTAIFSPSGGNVGIAFAIPASTAEGVVNQLKDHGSITRGWLGVSIQPISPEIADSLRLKDASGALVSDITKDSPAAKAGLVVGDAILSVDGQTVKDSRDLSLRISNIAPGKTVKVTYWRAGASHDANVTLGTLPSNQQLAVNNPPPTRNNNSGDGQHHDAARLRPHPRPLAGQPRRDGHQCRPERPGRAARPPVGGRDRGGRRLDGRLAARCRAEDRGCQGGRPEGRASPREVWRPDGVRRSVVRVLDKRMREAEGTDRRPGTLRPRDGRPCQRPAVFLLSETKPLARPISDRRGRANGLPFFFCPKPAAGAACFGPRGRANACRFGLINPAVLLYLRAPCAFC